MNPCISAIFAMSRNRVIGVGGYLPWDIPEDLEYFRSVTKGHPVIMGRKTFEAIGRLLPNRPNIIVTRNLDFSFPGAVVFHTVEEALAYAKTLDDVEVFIIGGAEIFTLAKSYIDRLYLTIVDAEIEGDTYFPEYSEFSVITSERVGSDENFKYTFYILEKSKNASK